MHAAKHLLRCLKGSIDLGITYSASASAGIEGIGGDLTSITYCDASYASDLHDSKSTTGSVIVLNGGAVSYRACKQGNVSLSSAKAEYVALCDAACDLVFVEFHNAPVLAPIVDKKHLGQSGQEPRRLSDSRIASDVTSDAASDASSDDEDIDIAQRMDIDAPHTTPRERETDPTIDDPTTSSSAIIADPAKKVPEPRSKIDRPTNICTRSFFCSSSREKGPHPHHRRSATFSSYNLYCGSC
jgi:hypothetical protein